MSPPKFLKFLETSYLSCSQHILKRVYLLSIEGANNFKKYYFFKSSLVCKCKCKAVKERGTKVIAV